MRYIVMLFLLTPISALSQEIQLPGIVLGSDGSHYRQPLLERLRTKGLLLINKDILQCHSERN